jgi:hypothetical protein
MDWLAPIDVAQTSILTYLAFSALVQAYLDPETETPREPPHDHQRVQPRVDSGPRRGDKTTGACTP